MEELKKIKLVEKFPGKERSESPFWFHSGKKIQNVDFHRIEQNRNQAVLSPFELEVKQKLASVPSPYDDLVRVEQEKELAKSEHTLKTQLGKLAKKVQLTSLERACYELLYVQRLAQKDVRRKLNMTQARLCQLIQQIETAFVRAFRVQVFRTSQNKNRGKYAFTSKQEEVIYLHEKKGQSFTQIANCLNVSRQAARRLYLRGLKKNSYRETRVSNL